jgi:hypothetical protein
MMRNRDDKDGGPVSKDELTTAKINAALKILEWSKDDIEPGVGGTPNQLHVALADAFRTVFGIISEAVGSSEEKDAENANRIPEGAIA